LAGGHGPCLVQSDNPGQIPEPPFGPMVLPPVASASPAHFSSPRSERSLHSHSSTSPTRSDAHTTSPPHSPQPAPVHLPFPTLLLQCPLPLSPSLPVRPCSVARACINHLLPPFSSFPFHISIFAPTYEISPSFNSLPNGGRTHHHRWTTNLYATSVSLIRRLRLRRLLERRWQALRLCGHIGTKENQQEKGLKKRLAGSVASGTEQSQSNFNTIQIAAYLSPRLEFPNRGFATKAHPDRDRSTDSFERLLFFIPLASTTKSASLRDTIFLRGSLFFQVSRLILVQSPFRTTSHLETGLPTYLSHSFYHATPSRHIANSCC